MKRDATRGRHGLVCLSCTGFKALTGKEVVVVPVCGACGGPMVEGWENDSVDIANASKREHGHPLVNDSTRKPRKAKKAAPKVDESKTEKETK